MGEGTSRAEADTPFSFGAVVVVGCRAQIAAIEVKDGI